MFSHVMDRQHLAMDSHIEEETHPAQVPLLEIGDQVVCESLDIVRLLGKDTRLLPPQGDGHIELNAGSRKQHASKGAVFFVSAGAQTNVTAGPSGMRLTRCHTNQKPGYN